METASNSKILKLLLRIWSEITNKRRRQIIALFFLMIFSGFAELLTLASIIPFLIVLSNPEKLNGIFIFKDLFEIFSIDNQTKMMIFATSIFGIYAIINMIVRVTNLYLNTRLSALIGSDLSSKVYENILNREYNWHLNVNTSELINNAINNVYNTVLFIKSFLNLVTQTSVAAFLIVGLTVIDGFVAIITSIAFILAYLILATLVRRRFEKNGRFMVISNQKLIKSLQEGFSSIREIILGNFQYKYVQDYKFIDKPNRLVEAELEFLKTAPRFGLEAICFLIISFLALFLTLYKGDFSSTLTTLGTLALGAQKLLPALQGIYYDWANSRDFYESVNSVLKIVSMGKTKSLDQERIPLMDFREVIELKNLSFSYDGENDNLIFKNINLKIKKGQKIGIIGKTGVGKTTLVDIIIGLLKPKDGLLKVDNRIINFEDNKSIKKWRSIISHVPQSIYLSDSTIIENIAFGIDPKEIDYERINFVSKKAALSEFINSLPKGFNTIVGERGMRLSGGQKQRLGIARALYKGSKILVFDEATSALDNKTESEVIKSLNDLSDKETTIIMIAHRLSTLKKCDLIIEVSKNDVKEVYLENE